MPLFNSAINCEVNSAINCEAKSTINCEAKCAYKLSYFAVILPLFNYDYLCLDYGLQ